MKRIIITEEQGINIHKMADDCEMKHESKPFCINPEKVLIVKKYLDKSIKRGNAETIGADGFPCKRPLYGMLSSSGEILQTLERERMIDMLIEKFKKMFLDSNERERFLTRVLDDWYDNKIGTFGTLSVNYV